MSKVFGIFAIEDVSDAVDLLGEYGYADDYKVIDRYNLRDERLLELAGRGSIEEGATPPIGDGADARPDVRTNEPAETPVTEGETDGAIPKLTDLVEGESEEEARYFARSIFSGAALLVVEVDDSDQAREVEALLQKVGAQSAGT